MRVSVATDPGRVRAVNEDNYCAIDLRPIWPGHAFAVADGMGGHQAGEVASALAVMTFLDVVRELLRDAGESGGGTVAEAIERAIQTANAAVAAERLPPGRRRRAPGEPTFMGTTLTAALVNEREVTWGHVGDSRAYLLRGGEVRQLTQDHSLVGEMVRSGSLSEAEAMGHPRRNILTNALGMPRLQQIDTGVEPVQPGDALLFCTDGLTSLVGAGEMSRLVRAAADAGESGWRGLAPQLVELANQRGAPDNVTVVAVYVP